MPSAWPVHSILAAAGAMYGTYEAFRYKVPGLHKVRYIGQVGVVLPPLSAPLHAPGFAGRSLPPGVCRGPTACDRPLVMRHDLAARRPRPGAAALPCKLTLPPLLLHPPADHPEQCSGVWAVPGGRLPAALRPESGLLTCQAAVHKQPAACVTRSFPLPPHMMWQRQRCGTRCIVGGMGSFRR